MEKITDEKLKKEIIDEMNRNGGIQLSTRIFDDDRVHYEATVYHKGKSYDVHASFPKEQYDEIMEASAGDEGMLPWDNVEFDVTTARKMEFWHKHQVISVPHQYPVKVWECDSFEEYAVNNLGWDYTIYHSMEEAAEICGGVEYIPEELADLIKKEGSAVEIDIESQDHNDYMSVKDFDPEAEAREFCGDDYYRMIVIDTVDEAREIAATYHGHKEIEVRSAARQIIEKAHEVDQSEDAEMSM